MSASGKYGELIARLAGDIGQDREIDALMWLTQPEQSGYEFIGYSDEWRPWKEYGLDRLDVTNPDSVVQGLIFRDADGNVQAFASAPRYTGSQDDALSLLESGWEYSISTLYCIARVELPLNDTRIQSESAEHKGCDVPRAICMAALAALKALSHTAKDGQ